MGKEVTKSLAERMRERLNEKVGKEFAKSFSSKEDLMQVKSWITLKPFFKDASGGEGFPCGHLTQIIGKPDSGKTTLMMEGMVETQRQGGVVFLIDSEHKFSLERLRLMGGRPEEVVVMQVDTLEAAWDAIFEACRVVEEQRGAGVDSPMMICWDSVAASVPAKMLEEDDSGKAHVAVEAKLNNKNIRKLKGLMVKTQVCCVFINHYYMTQPMSMYEQPELVIKGGEEMEFLTTLVIRTKKGKKLERVVKSEKQKIGRVTRFEIHKGHFHGRTIVKDVFVVDKGILESKEDLEEYQKGLRGVL